MKSESAKPLIGIVVCGLSDNRQFVSNPYIQSVRYSGGIPILLPLIRSDTMLEQYLRLCDGFLFCGGNDITPLLFGQEPREGIGNTNITLDLFQIRLMKLILSSAKPVFSICRGMQIFNTACQGTMFQDIRYQPGESLDHMQRSDSRSVSAILSGLKGLPDSFPVLADLFTSTASTIRRSTGRELI